MRRGIPVYAKRWRLLLMGAVGVCLCATVMPAAAKVFRFLGPTDSRELNDGRYGWETAYETRMTVNGRPARMRLYSARFSEPVLNQLETRFEQLGAEVMLAKSGDGATGTAGGGRDRGPVEALARL